MNKTIFAYVLTLCVCTCSYAQNISSVSFCEDNEQELFICQTGTKSASVCFNKKTGTSYYQFKNQDKKIELRIPYNQQKKNFKQTIKYFAGGFGHQIRITNDRTTYTVYSFLSKDMDEEGYMTPIYGAGILVQKDGATIVDLICEDGGGEAVSEDIANLYPETDYNFDFLDDPYWGKKFAD